ncbi:MAG TPA: glycosyltransferase [Candidatus Obscuribacterales bacterium]
MPQSLIVTTSPGREANLEACLQQLTRQRFQDFEVLVCDDGSQGCRAVAQAYSDRLDLRYFWRSNDLNVARSRNLGIAQARHPQLIFFDADILLNPAALAAYDALIPQSPRRIWMGYFGHILNHSAPSAFVTGRTVNYLDPRIEQYGYQFLKPSTLLRDKPGLMFWGGNMAMPREVCQSLQGFDERYVGWGYEDSQFAFKALEAGYELHYCVDAWGEHQAHGYQEPFHQTFDRPDSQAREMARQCKQGHPQIHYRLEVASTPEVTGELCRLILSHYAQQDPDLNDSFKAAFRKPEVRLMQRETGFREWDLAFALPRQQA